VGASFASDLSVASTTRFYSLAAAAIGMVVGWVIMLTHLDDPAHIGPGMAISLLTCTYALGLAFLLALPLQAHIEDHIPGAADGSVTASAVVATMLTVLCGINSFSMLLLSFAEPAQ